jgi:segregation and condensation protein A
MVPDSRRTTYIIRYEDIFDGPIDLLLELIRKKKIAIYDINLSFIINGFIEHMRKNGEVMLETMSGFVYFSSILLEIKSQSLLPSRKKQEEESQLDADILKRREEEYRIYNKVSNYFSSKIQEGALLLVREAPMEKTLINILPDFLQRLDPIQLWMTAGRLFARTSLDLDISNAYNHRSTINIFDEMERIKSVLCQRREITFREISSVHESIIDLIISFLSLLELYKNEEVEILQFESFGNIIIRSR